ncbi:MAG: RNA 3'-phosphate cyclase [Methanoregulaceae archaeon]|nr:RNA 3'-phosphate cyclase [Methanoregulaceae archaeon]
MLMIDGSYLEGGGQIVRASAALSAVTGTPVEITRIRENRKKPGLGYQHCAAVRAVACACHGQLANNRPGSSSLSFIPGAVRNTECTVDVGTAGSIPLVIQAWLPVALIKGGSLVVTGGTEVPLSPTVDYLEKVLFPALGTPAAGVSLRILKRGYYPAGGGVVRVTVTPADPEPVTIKQETICGIRSCSSGLPSHVAEQQASRAAVLLCEALGEDIPVEIQQYEGLSKGSSCTAWCGAKGSSSLGRPGLPAGKVGELTARGLIRELGQPGEVDSHMSDQLLIYLARYGGSYTASEYTFHARTMCWLLSRFGFEIRVREGQVVGFSA